MWREACVRVCVCVRQATGSDNWGMVSKGVEPMGYDCRQFKAWHGMAWHRMRHQPTGRQAGRQGQGPKVNGHKPPTLNTFTLSILA